MAYIKQTWENLPSTNTPITAERLNHMEDGIDEAWQHGGGGAGETLPVGSEIEFQGETTDIPEGWEYSEDDYNVYSTDEKVVGTWIDGKPIYRKTYTGTAVSSGRVILDTIASLDTLVSYKGWTESSYNWIWGVPCSASTYENNIRFTKDDNTLQLSFGQNYSSSNNFAVTVEYTKTTD